MVILGLSSCYFSEWVSPSLTGKRHEQAFMCKEHLKCYDLNMNHVIESVAVPSGPKRELQDSTRVMVRCVAAGQREGQGVAQM